MGQVIETKPQTSRRLFSLAIIAYLLVTVGVLVFTLRVFVMGLAVGLEMIFIFPIAVAMRMRSRWPDVRVEEFALLVVLVAFVWGGSAYVIWYNYDRGMHIEHAQNLKFEAFRHELRKDPAFRNVTAEYVRWMSRYSLKGTVASQADWDRLKALADRFGFGSWIEDVAIASRRRAGPQADPRTW
jgi:hypothetical protein